MNKLIWLFVKKESRKKPIYKAYGNLRQLSKDEVIVINGKTLTENTLRTLLKGSNFYEDKNYRLQKLTVKRSIHIKN